MFTASVVSFVVLQLKQMGFYPRERKTTHKAEMHFAHRENKYNLD